MKPKNTKKMHNSFESEELQAPLAEINMTPLVDVMLVLLVIFLITAPMLNSSIKLNLPKESAAPITEKKPLVISINDKGQYYVNDQEISFSDLEQQLKIASQKDQKKQIHLRADTDVNYGKVSSILATLQNLGLSNIGFITEPQ